MRITALSDTPRTRTRLIGTILLGVLLAGCSTLSRLPAVPPEANATVEILAEENIRFRVPIDIHLLAREGERAQDREIGKGPPRAKSRNLGPADFLALSGGGDSGAFGAGFLVGWSEHGSRPDFKMVTGVSTGALAAPFAFLGPNYDATLETVYTRIGPEDILEEQYLSGGLFGDAVADSSPLKALIAKHIDSDVLDAIAAEYAKGRLLWIITTDLDSMTPVIWNMGAIASSQSEGALKLFRDVLAASAAIPGIFPPVMIDAEVDGLPYQEMHVDGGVSAQVFFYPPSIRATDTSIKPRKRRLFIIRNARIAQDTVTTDRSTLDILQRAISAMIRSQGIGDLYRIFATTQRDDIEFNLAHIEEEFSVPKEEDFDTGFMNSLFRYGKSVARNGFDWRHEPPGFSLPKKDANE